MNKLFLSLGLFFFQLSIQAQDLQWVKRLDTKNNYSLSSSSIKRDALNNIIMVGMYSDTTDFDLGPNVFKLTPSGGPNVDIFMAKYTSNGDFIWAKKIAGNTWTSIWDFTIDKNNNIILSLFMNNVVDLNPSSAVYNVGTLGIRTSILAKYSSAGNFVWAKTFSENGIFSRISTDSQGKILAAGHFYYTVDFNPGTGVNNLVAQGNSSQVFILKLNSTGTFSWVKQIGDSTNTFENVYDLQLDTFNNIYLAGRFVGLWDVDPSSNQYFLNSQGKAVGYFAKYNPNGNFMTAGSFYSTGNSMVTNIRTDKKGNIILSGLFIGTCDLDASNATLNVTATATNDFFITKYSPLGNMKWGFDVGNVSEEFLKNHEVGPNGNTYIFGRFKGKVDFDPSPIITNLVSAPTSQSDLFFVAYDTAGALISAKKLGNNKVENPLNFTLSKTGELCLFGNFAGTVDFDFTSSTNNLTATDQDFFIAKYSFSNFRNAIDEETVIINTSSIEKEASVVIYPNPVVSQLQIKTTVDIKLENIKVYNLQGVCVLNTNLNKIDNDSSPYSLDVSQLTPGFYVIKINNQFNETFIKL